MRRSESLRLLLLAMTLLAVVVALISAGHALPAPPITVRLDGWPLVPGGPWLQRLGPAGALMALVRLLALIGAGYLLAVVVLELAALRTGWPAMPATARWLAAPWARQLVRGLTGLSVATSITATSLGVALMPLPAPSGARTVSISIATGPIADDLAPTMHRLDPDPTTTSSAAGPVDSAPTMRRLDPEPDPSIPTLAATPSAPTPFTTAPSTTATTWTIEPGDHLWGVAAHTLAAAWSRPASDAEVDHYLMRLIEQNRDMLTVPGDPDLVLPGQVFVLVPVAG